MLGFISAYLTFISHELPGPAWNTISLPPAPQASKLTNAPMLFAQAC